jgi:hypothetical protein
VAQLTRPQVGGGADTLLYLTTDHLGTPIQATDTAGALVWEGGLAARRGAARPVASGNGTAVQLSECYTAPVATAATPADNAKPARACMHRRRLRRSRKLASGPQPSPAAPRQSSSRANSKHAPGIRPRLARREARHRPPQPALELAVAAGVNRPVVLPEQCFQSVRGGVRAVSRRLRLARLLPSFLLRSWNAPPSDFLQGHPGSSPRCVGEVPQTPSSPFSSNVIIILLPEKGTGHGYI